MTNDTSEQSSLEELRQLIDAIDVELHQKIIERVGLIDKVAEVKQNMDGNFHAMRPSREASMLRELEKRHQGQMQVGSVIRIWRELINGATALQGPYSVAVCVPEELIGYWDIARNHFGSTVPMTFHTSPSVVLQRVQEVPGAIGLLPLPQMGEEEPWWPALAGETDTQTVPRVIWRLPFYSLPTGQCEKLEALAVAKLVPEASGQDMTLLSIETDRDTSQARLLGQLEIFDFASQPLSIQEAGEAGRHLLLIELEGFINPDDCRLQSLQAKMGDEFMRIAVLGAYPKSLTQDIGKSS